MNTNELRNKSSKELQEEVQALLKEQFNLRMQTQKVSNFKQVRRNIARIKTILNEKKGQEKNHD
jgi:large subunit ribosomal protein L29